MELCWFEGKHQGLGKEPLDCLKCKRMTQRIMDKPEDPKLSLFMDGYRLAMFEVAAYAQPFTKQQEDMIRGLDLRFKCAIDRGISLDQLQRALGAITKKILRDVPKGKTEG